MQMHKYVISVTYVFHEMQRLKYQGAGNGSPHLILSHDYSLANNQIAKTFIVLSVFIPVCLYEK